MVIEGPVDMRVAGARAGRTSVWTRSMGTRTGRAERPDSSIALGPWIAGKVTRSWFPTSVSDGHWWFASSTSRPRGVVLPGGGFESPHRVTVIEGVASPAGMALRPVGGASAIPRLPRANA